MTNHPWKLVGPWYRSDSVGSTGAQRQSAPIIQKYAAADFANRIVQEPQMSLRFNSEDFVNPITADPDEVVSPQKRAESSSPYKLFLDTHSRFYVVICELHCDMPGFPNVDRKQVCEAGFVVRRRVPVVTPALQKEVNSLLRQRSQLLNDRTSAVAAMQAGNKDDKNVDLMATVKAKSAHMLGSLRQASVEVIDEKLSTTLDKLNGLVSSGDIKIQLQGWQPGLLKGVGNWQQVDETPEEINELAIPLYPLIADPSMADHSAQGKTLWFGVIPTASGDTDSSSSPRFDDTDLYEIRCFVRRHKSQFPLKANQQDCCGEVVWSAPSESYQVASHYDLDGTSHRPVNIKLPDLPALKAQADMAPPGRGANARIIAPPESSLNFATDKMELPEGGEPVTRPGQQICFFAIFLFFIVAMFLFRLFLPILLFIFNLWFLLKLKFCIPPSIEFDAGLVADLSFEGSFGVDFDASIQAHVDLMVDFSADLAVQMSLQGPDIEANFALPGYSLTVNQGKDNEKTYLTAAQLKADLGLLITNSINATDDMRSDMVNGSGKGAGLNDSTTLNEMASIYIAMQTEYQDIRHPELAGSLPAPEKGLVYFDKIVANKVAA